MTRKDAKRILLAGAFMIGLTSLACDSATGPVQVQLSAIHIRGTVTSTVDGEPIEGVGVVLAGGAYAGFFGSGRSTDWGWTDAEGNYAITKENNIGRLSGRTFSCSPETFEIGFYIPDGYRMLTDGEYLFVVQCVEDVQVFDFQFEPF